MTAKLAAAAVVLARLVYRTRLLTPFELEQIHISPAHAATEDGVDIISPDMFARIGIVRTRFVILEVHSD